MPARSKLQDLDEALEWLREGRTYRWIVAEYERRYGVITTPSMWSRLRQKYGIGKRIVRDRTLIPWFVEPRHRHGHAVAMLRAAARRRAGVPLTRSIETSLEAWLEHLREGELVVRYDRASELGWHYVPRRQGHDLDLIREPGDNGEALSTTPVGITGSTHIGYPDGRTVPFDPLLLGPRERA